MIANKCMTVHALCTWLNDCPAFYSSVKLNWRRGWVRWVAQLAEFVAHKTGFIAYPGILRPRSKYERRNSGL